MPHRRRHLAVRWLRADLKWQARGPLLLLLVHCPIFQHCMAATGTVGGSQVVTQALQPLTFASHTYDTFHLVMPLYVCRKWSGQLHGLEGQQMAWVAEQQMQDYAMPAADVPLVGPVLQAMRTAIVDS
eukprot:GHRR01028560.1.p1 GENE.GHRR01028560.1~~GHRR01028560.1.p1  ORF type:complete len:128 (+),score=30.32 GHRR01028560.1:239-622(+)